MAIKSAPRVRVPAQAKAGELIEIKTLISHEMESGQRKDAAGKTVADIPSLIARVASVIAGICRS